MTDDRINFEETVDVILILGREFSKMTTYSDRNNFCVFSHGIMDSYMRFREFLSFHTRTT